MYLSVYVALAVLADLAQAGLELTEICMLLPSEC